MDPEKGESSGDEVDAETVEIEGGDRVGFYDMTANPKKKPVYTWIAICGSTLYHYKSAKAVSPKGDISLVDSVSSTCSEGELKESGIVVKGKDGQALVYFLVSNKKERDNFIEFLNEAAKKDPGLPPKKEKTRRASLKMRAAKGVSGKIAVSGLGKKGVKKAIPEELEQLVVALGKIISKVQSRKVADQTEENLIKILLKAFFLEREKLIKLEDILKADQPVRKAFEVLTFARDNMHRMKPETVEAKLQLVHDYLKEVQKILTDILTPHLKPHTIKRISDTFGLLADPDFLKQAWSMEDLEEERDLLADTMNRYLQFELNL